MSATPAAGSPEHGQGERAPDARRPPPPAERGATVIPDRVVARIAARVARTELHRLGGPREPLTDLAAPGVRVRTHEGTAHLALSVDLPYPTDIADACRHLQREVADQVAQLTGLDVSDVTLIIRRLATADRPGRVR